MKWLGMVLVGMCSLGWTLGHAQPKERTIEEIKSESLARAQRGAYPLGGLDPKDVAQALSHIQTRDRDEWAAGWGKVAQNYVDQAKSASSKADTSAAYKKAWRLYYFAQWPVPNSPGKQAAYDKAIEAYLKYAEALDPPMEQDHHRLFAFSQATSRQGSDGFGHQWPGQPQRNGGREL